MPRMSAILPPMERRPAAARARRKPAAMQDRLTARSCFCAGCSRSLKPGLWFLVISVLAVGGELIHTLPPVRRPRWRRRPPPPRRQGSAAAGGLADMAAALGLRVAKVVVTGAQTTTRWRCSAPSGCSRAIPRSASRWRRCKPRAAIGAGAERYGGAALPGTLVVNVTERNAYAIWQTVNNGQTQFLLIDNDGNVIANQDAAAAKRREPWLLLLTGPDAPVMRRS